MLFIPNEKGQGLVEYALIIVLIALVAIIIVTALGQLVEAQFYGRIVAAFENL